MDGATSSVALHLDAKHPVKLAKVGHLHVLPKTCLEGIDGGGAVRGDGAVVNVHGNDNKNLRGLEMFVENCLVDLALCESEAGKDLCELLVPASSGLLESVQGLAQPK